MTDMADDHSATATAIHDFDYEQWWLAAPEHLLVWARLRVLRQRHRRTCSTATATRCTYDSEDIARAALMDADFRSLDGMDDDDADDIGLLARGPGAAAGRQRRRPVAQMVRTLGPRLGLRH